MNEVVHNKLVRDKIPQIIRAENHLPVTHILNEQEYRHALFTKLVEEANELLESDGSLDERSDIAEVLKAVDELLGFSAEEVEAARVFKAKKRGGFATRIFLEKVILNDGPM